MRLVFRFNNDDDDDDMSRGLVCLLVCLYHSFCVLVYFCVLVLVLVLVRLRLRLRLRLITFVPSLH